MVTKKNRWPTSTPTSRLFQLCVCVCVCVVGRVHELGINHGLQCKVWSISPVGSYPDNSSCMTYSSPRMKKKKNSTHGKYIA